MQPNRHFAPSIVSAEGFTYLVLVCGWLLPAAWRAKGKEKVSPSEFPSIMHSNRQHNNKLVGQCSCCKLTQLVVGTRLTLFRKSRQLSLASKFVLTFVLSRVPYLVRWQLKVEKSTSSQTIVSRWKRIATTPVAALCRFSITTRSNRPQWLQNRGQARKREPWVKNCIVVDQEERERDREFCGKKRGRELIDWWASSSGWSSSSS